MSVWGTVRVAIAVLVLVMLHFTIRPLLAWRAEMDFLLIALLITAVRVRPGVAALIGFLIGLSVDSLTPLAFGASALGMTAVGFAASRLKAVFFADNLALNGFFFFLGKWVFDLIRMVSERRVQGVELVMQALLWAPLSAALTAAVGVLLLVLLRPLLLETSVS
jgi:rod shape-determining protein MreD